MTLTDLTRRFEPVCVDTALGRISYRCAGAPGEGEPLVLLHGIGSGSGSWVRQLEAFGSTHHVLAWDAPGYGESQPLPMAQPRAQDYAQRMWAWLDALGALQPVTLVGHSLGALMAAAAAGLQPLRVARLVLLSPAQGYGRAPAGVREARLRDRLDNLAALGPGGMADKRGAAMLSGQAPPELVAYVKAIMAQVIPAGYTQATHMLSNSDLAGLLSQVRCPVTVASGAADTITPPDGCEAVARAAQAPYVSLGGAGHACALEAAGAVNALFKQVREEQ